MMLVPSAVPATAPVTRRLLGPDLAPDALGALTVETLPAGARQERTVDPESATVVLAGRITLGPDPLGPGDCRHHPHGSTATLTALDDTVLLTVHAIEGDNPRGAGNGALRKAASLQPPADRRLHAGRPPTSALHGSEQMGIRWLVTSPDGRLTLATSVFTPGGSHSLHRHPAADEFFLVLAGGGEHLTDRGHVRLSAGELVYIPAGEWHGYRTHPGVTTTALYGYLGAGSLARAGYQVREPAEPAEPAERHVR